MDFKELVKNNKQTVRNIIKLITKETNEDLEQEVYVKVWRNSDKYQEQGNLKSWISTIAKNVSKDYLKSSYRKTLQNSTSDDVVIASIKDNKVTPAGKFEAKLRQKTIIKAIENLKPTFKQVIIMYEINGLSYEEIAQKLNCPLGTVKSRLYNAKKILAEELKNLM